MHRLSHTPAATFENAAERRLGRLCALFDYTSIEEILAGGVQAFASNVRHEFELLSYDIEDAYFPRLPVTPVSP